MINTAEVILWGTRIGIVHQDDDRPYVSFEYDRDFIKSGIELSPIKMKLSSQVYDLNDKDCIKPLRRIFGDMVK